MWRYFDPSCLWCGARLIQQIGRLELTKEVMTLRRRAVLADWMALGHSEQELRALAKGKTMPVAPITKGRSK